MYPLGVLFGLGFDTATEIGVLGISAGEATKGLPVWSILIFPTLFAAGMSLIDTTDNILMLGAYGWAFVKPIRKLYYNMTITSVSVVVAVAVGGIEALGLMAGQFHLKGTFWEAVGRLNENFGTLGYFIVGLFAVSWIVSVAFYKWRRFDDLNWACDLKLRLHRLKAFESIFRQTYPNWCKPRIYAGGELVTLITRFSLGLYVSPASLLRASPAGVSLLAERIRDWGAPFASAYVSRKRWGVAPTTALNCPSS